MILPPRLKGSLMVLAASVCWSIAGLVVRHVEAQGLPVVFARSAFMALGVGIYLAIVHRERLPGVFKAAGLAGVLSGALLGASFVMFILSVTYMPVANAYVLMCGSPLVSALLARWWLKEELSWPVIAAILAGISGIGLMFADGMGEMSLLGTLFGLGVAVAFGANVVVLRRKRSADMVTAAFLGGLFSALATLPFAEIETILPGDLPWLALLGFVQLGAGLILFVRGTRYLPSAEASLLTLGEAILAPVWVWLFFSETPSLYTVAGGLIVLGAVAFQTVVTSR
ncbi:MAG: DMT family transporter [Rhodospirillales bacterium]|nr:MAG: DMT family transporter [Rhodospirillales bacterium]